MSLCRWSSNNFRCDLYCYQAVDGFRTHVASCRIVGDLPMPLLNAIMRQQELGLSDDDVREVGRAHHKAMDEAERIPIGLPYDGASFTDGTLEDWKARIAGLIELGYQVPDGVLEEINEQILQLSVAAPEHLPTE